MKKIGSAGIFIILLALSVFLAIRSNVDKRIFMFNTVSSTTGGLRAIGLNIKNYFHLEKENDSLINFNQKLLEENINSKVTPAQLQYSLVRARVVGNSVDKKNNIILIAAGKKQGIEEGMGVISKYGNVVGKVISVSKNYSAAISILNSLYQFSGKHKRLGLLGTVQWHYGNPQYLYFNDIRLNTPIQSGDTIVTSGYSTAFPPGLVFGIIDSIGTSDVYKAYKLRLKIPEKIELLDYVYIIKNKDAKEINTLREKTQLIIEQ